MKVGVEGQEGERGRLRAELVVEAQSSTAELHKGDGHSPLGQGSL